MVHKAISTAVPFSDIWLIPSQIRLQNALLFDFLLKRRLTIAGVSLPAAVFQTRTRFS